MDEGRHPAPSPHAELWGGDLRELADVGEPLDLRRGDVLIRRGDASDSLYFVLSGRLGVYVSEAGAPVAEIGQGQPVGEVGFFASLPRTATVAALRDSRVLAISRARFEQSSAQSPRIRDAVIVALARRLARAIDQPVEGRALARTVAIVPAGRGTLPPAFVARLREAFAGDRRAVFIGAADVRARAGGSAMDAADTSAWLNALEAEADVVFYVADDTPTDWTQKCVRQADALVLVATSGEPTALSASEALALAVHPVHARRLVVLHPERRAVTAGTAAWLNERDVLMVHHVSLQDGADFDRLQRFVTGRAVGLVASGGGALGPAHLGVYKALTEGGVVFDALGGTSVGAAMMAALACGMTPERADEATHNVFVRARAFRRYTLPRYGLLDHTVFDRALRTEYGETRIEDLWMPFFAVSSDLAGHEAHVHRRGPVWHAVRASGSVPGVLPPFFTGDGEMLVDGALRTNVPLGPMKALKDGPNVVIRLRLPDRTSYRVRYDAIPGARQLVTSMLTPWRRRALPDAPNPLQVIVLGMLASSDREVTLGERDLLVAPDLPPGVRFTSWTRHTEVFHHAHRSCARWMQQRRDEDDPRLLGLLPTPR